jgi:DNA-binding PadR family transcriptional regulator
VAILGKSKAKILRELDHRSLHGYELAKKLDIPITGIYQHLKHLTADGLIASNGGQGRRKFYSLTKKGQTLLDVLNCDHHG